jgi:carboxypeptidase T
MRRFIVLTTLLFILGSTQDMIVRVYVPTWQELRKIDEKSLDIAAGRHGEWFDLVADDELLGKVIASGLPHEVMVHSLEYEKDQVRGYYLSYTEINDSLRNLAQTHASICMLDSLPFTTYEGRWIYGVKISNNPQIEEDEPGFTLDGCHHSREWATPQAVLFFADSMISSYGTIPEITDIINRTQIFCFPIINVDGYVYDYPDTNWWRKNREPFGGAIGTDPNRNYGGALNGEVDGYWGAADEGQVSHRPMNETFCGAYAYSGDEIWAYTTYIREHKIVTGFSLHSYGEQVMYPWGYKPQGTSDSILYDQKGAHMAGMMQSLISGTYYPAQSYFNPYPSVGNTRDWVYGYNHYVAGLSSLFYGAEIGTSFYQNQNDLDSISHQVFKAAKYLAGFADSLTLVTEGVVPAPVIHPLGTVNADFTLGWQARNPAHNNPLHWELLELSNPSVIEDNLENGTDRWMLQGFTLSTAQAHSGTHSYFSGSVDDMNSAVQIAHPYLVGTGDSVTFWCWYDLETNYDVAVVEVSENTKEWFNLDTTRFNGNSNGWIRKAYSLEDWIGKSVYIRFRAMTDGGVLDVGFYVDDIYPTCYFPDIDTISSNISDTLYGFTDHSTGEYYYSVRGYNSTYGWGDLSCLEKVVVTVGIAQGEIQELTQIRPSLALLQNPFNDQLHIVYILGSVNVDAAQLCIHDATGRLVRTFRITPYALRSTLSWDGRDESGRSLPNGVYFVHFDIGKNSIVKKAVLLR